MYRKLIYSLIIGSLLITGFFACSNKNSGYKEYYHPMGNNPVQVIPWLISVRKSLYKNEARISWYELEGREYYLAQSFIPTDKLKISPCTIYEANDKEGVVYFHTDDSLLSEQDSIYIYFIQKADLIEVLWSNEIRYSTVE